MPDDRRWNLLAARLLAGLTILRLVWHLLTPVGMAGDEAYYWEWGRHPAWGYFSKPPLIAWLYGALGRAANDSLYAFKAAATLLAAGGLWFLFLATRRAFDSRVAFWTLAASSLGVGNTLLASILTIDAPLLFAWSAALYFYLRLLTGKGPPGWSTTVLLALSLALGGLSKQMMFTFVPLMLAGAWFARRDLLHRPHLYLAAAFSFLALVPTLVWNIRRDWVTFHHTAHHFEAADGDMAAIASRYLEFAGVAALLLTPVIFGLMVATLVTFRRWGGLPPAAKALVCLGPVPLVVVLLFILRQDMNPNWPAAFYPATLALTAWWCLRPGHPVRAAWLRAGVVLAGVMSLAVMVVLPLHDHLGIRAQRRGWHGYPELARSLHRVARRVPGAAANPAFLVDGHRFTASQLAFHFRHHPGIRVYNWPDRDSIGSQHDFWPGPPLGSDLLLVVERGSPDDDGRPGDRLTESFESITDLGAEIPQHPSRALPTFKIYLARGLKDWPALPQQSRTH